MQNKRERIDKLEGQEQVLEELDGDLFRHELVGGHIAAGEVIRCSEVGEGVEPCVVVQPDGYGDGDKRQDDHERIGESAEREKISPLDFIPENGECKECGEHELRATSKRQGDTKRSDNETA